MQKEELEGDHAEAQRRENERAALFAELREAKEAEIAKGETTLADDIFVLYVARRRLVSWRLSVRYFCVPEHTTNSDTSERTVQGSAEPEKLPHAHLEGPAQLLSARPMRRAACKSPDSRVGLRWSPSRPMRTSPSERLAPQVVSDDGYWAGVEYAFELSFPCEAPNDYPNQQVGPACTAERKST